MKFKSKIGWWFHLTALLILLVGILQLIWGITDGILELIISGAIVLLIFLLLVLPIYIASFYVLEDTALYIRSGLCVNKRILYKDISAINETRNPLASAALSLDRVSIEYSGKKILVSPKDKQKFIKQLKQRTTDKQTNGRDI
jgi:uncharacterized membrane protein YdbT with pleckstrin-like domain